MSKDERDPDPDDRSDDESDPGKGSSANSTPPPSAKPRKDTAAAKRGPTRRTVLIGFAVGAVGGLGGGFGLGYWYGRRGRRRPPRKPPKPAYVPLLPHSARKGPSPAKVTIVEFSEFQCPYCGRAVPVLEEILKKYEGDVAVVFRHQPLPFHKHAKGAAIAFQAALRQNKAWELHDLMFENRKRLAPEEIFEHAAKVGLDVEQFKKDVADPAVLAEVEADMAAAKEAGVRGTPAFYINGNPIRGAKPLDEFVKVVDQELQRADELIAAGTPLASVYETRAKELVALEKAKGTK